MFSSQVKVIFWAVLFEIQFRKAKGLETMNIHVPSVSLGYGQSWVGARVGTGSSQENRFIHGDLDRQMYCMESRNDTGEVSREQVCTRRLGAECKAPWTSACSAQVGVENNRLFGA